MDDFNLPTLRGSRDEWCIRLINILTPQIIKGIRSIFNTSYSQCIENNEPTKYLVTFQNYLTRIPKWNHDLIENEYKRIVEESGCTYLDDLIMCVHIIQLKMLTCIRVGTKQKKVDLDVPKVEKFIHKIYIHAARELYTKVYLFLLDASPIEKQKNNDRIEQIIQNCIHNALSESMPDKKILRAFLEETDETVEEIKEEIIKETINPIKTSTHDGDTKTKKSGGGALTKQSLIPAVITHNDTGKYEDDSHSNKVVQQSSVMSPFKAFDGSPVLSMQSDTNKDKDTTEMIEEFDILPTQESENSVYLNLDDSLIELS